MSNDHLEICGIASEFDLPEYTSNYPYKEICRSDELQIPYSESEIDAILQVFIDSSIKKFHVIHTNDRKKLVIYASLNIKILYVANNSTQSVHSANFNIPFCTFISLVNINYKVSDISIYVEDSFINQIDNNKFILHTLLFITPTFNKTDDNSPNFNLYREFNYDSLINDSSNNDSIEYNLKYTMNTNPNIQNINDNNKDYLEYKLE